MKNMNSAKAYLTIKQISTPWLLIIPRNSRLEACSQIRIRNRACKTTWPRSRSNRLWKSKWASIHSRQNRTHWASRMPIHLPYEELELVKVQMKGKEGNRRRSLPRPTKIVYSICGSPRNSEQVSPILFKAWRSRNWPKSKKRIPTKWTTALWARVSIDRFLKFQIQKACMTMAKETHHTRIWYKNHLVRRDSRPQPTFKVSHWILTCEALGNSRWRQETTTTQHLHTMWNTSHQYLDQYTGLTIQ